MRRHRMGITTAQGHFASIEHLEEVRRQVAMNEWREALALSIMAGSAPWAIKERFKP